MGAYGYATSGGVFFDTRSSPDGDTAWDNEIDTLDTCMGHSNDAMQYHYHGVRNFLTIFNIEKYLLLSIILFSLHCTCTGGDIFPRKSFKAPRNDLAPLGNPQRETIRHNLNSSEDIPGLEYAYLYQTPPSLSLVS